MELKEFIKMSIEAIVDATSELQTKYEKDDVILNPPAPQSGNDVFQTGSGNYTFRRVQNIQFDIAVTAANEKSSNGSAGIEVLSLKIGGGVDQTNVAESVSRVAFSVPITLKPSAKEGDNIKARDAN